MNWTNVDSSNIAAISYDETKQELYVRFHADPVPGAYYVYLAVPVLTHTMLMGAKSKGKALIQLVKGKHEFERRAFDGSILSRGK